MRGQDRDLFGNVQCTFVRNSTYYVKYFLISQNNEHKFFQRLKFNRQYTVSVTENFIYNLDFSFIASGLKCLCLSIIISCRESIC